MNITCNNTFSNNSKGCQNHTRLSPQHGHPVACVLAVDALSLRAVEQRSRPHYRLDRVPWRVPLTGSPAPDPGTFDGYLWSLIYDATYLDGSTKEIKGSR